MVNKVIIAGGGVGGLTLARALLVKAKETKLDVGIVVLEKTPQLAVSGHGLTLFEGTGILHRLALSEELDNVSSVLTHQVISADGSFLVDTSGGNTGSSNKDKERKSEQSDVPLFAPRGIRRPDLVQLLKNSLPEDVIKFDWEIVRIVEGCNQVRVSNQRDEEVVGDLLVGFDGISGRVREAVFTDNKNLAHPSGSSSSKGRDFGQCCVVLGTACNKQKSSAESYDWLTSIASPNALVHHFDRNTGSVGVYSSTTNGQIAWTIGYRCPEEPERNLEWNNNDKALEAAKTVVQQWSGSDNATTTTTAACCRFQDLLKHSSGCLQLGVYTKSNKEVQQAWHSGRIVLGGDAAHAVLPLLGEGANLAMSDAVVLARQIIHAVIEQKSNPAAKPLSTDRLEKAFGAYEVERRGPSQSGMAMAKALRPVMLSQNWILCQLRNLMMKHMVPAKWNTSRLRGRDAALLLDRPIKQDRNPHANIMGSNIGIVMAHVAVIGAGVGMAFYVLRSS